MEYYEIAVHAFALLAAIAAVTPTDKDDTIVERIRNLAMKIKNILTVSK